MLSRLNMAISWQRQTRARGFSYTALAVAHPRLVVALYPPPLYLFTCCMSETGLSQDPAGFARRLLRGRDRGALATSLHGAPYASLVLVAADLDASPLLLLSDLAQHSRNIAFEPRVSLYRLRSRPRVFWCAATAMGLRR